MMMVKPSQIQLKKVDLQQSNEKNCHIQPDRQRKEYDDDVKLSWSLKIIIKKYYVFLFIFLIILQQLI